MVVLDLKSLYHDIVKLADLSHYVSKALGLEDGENEITL
jgi:hypothetical protein